MRRRRDGIKYMLELKQEECSKINKRVTNDHGKRTVTHKRDNPVARVSIDLVLLMGKTVKEGRRGESGAA